MSRLNVLLTLSSLDVLLVTIERFSFTTQKVGKRLRKLRRNMDLTQEELAERLGVSVNFIGQVERGTNAPSFETLQKIAEVLGVSVREFYDFPEDKKD